MRVRLLTSIASRDEPKQIGEVVDLPDAIAAEWIRERLAEAADGDAVQTATVSVPEQAMRRRRRA